MEKKQIVKLGDFVDYQDNSIVSKEIVKNKKGNITIFAFDKGEGLSEHTSPFDATIYILEGEAEAVISSEVFGLRTGEAIIMPANEPHSLKAVKKFKMVLFMIKA
ncbi:MAG: cupin domain-containing protein [Candidatus Omnitrophica bacterium]|nr:cupin domain-containing protein [Candidatus Omnitrophota bacterium]